MKTIAINSDSQGDDEKMFQKSLIHSVKKLLNPTKNKKEEARSATKEITIFLVDDDLFYLKALKHSISDKLPSVNIKTFQTGEACLEHMKLKPEVVILDYYLNTNVKDAMDGLTILKKIKKLNPKTKVIMLSSQDSLDIAVKCSDNGSFDYIAKSETAFLKINNELMNVVEEMEIIDEGMKPYQVIGIIIIITLIVALLLK